jgi:hypothetical protein
MENSGNKIHYKLLFLGENFKLKNSLVNKICGQTEYQERAILCCDYRYKIAQISGKEYNVKILNIDSFDYENITISEYIKCVHCVIFISDKISNVDRIECGVKYIVSSNDRMNTEDVNSVENFFNKIIISIINFYESKDIILEDENKIVFQYKKKTKKKKSFSCY